MTKPETYKRNQRGGALLVAMVMLFMMSIMGLSAMRGSTLEKRMAINSIKSATVFHAAESTSDAALNDDANLIRAYNAELNGTVRGPINLKSSIESANRFELTYTGEGLAPGYSANGDGFQTLRFEAVGESQITGARSKSIIEQGAYKVVPRDNR